MKKQDIDFGTLPRDGQVYRFYRENIIRLGLVVAALTAIVCWAWSGSWVTVRSYLFPSGTADLDAVSQTPMQIVTEDPEQEDFLLPDKIQRDGMWIQDGCYRLEVTLDSVETMHLGFGSTSVYRVSAAGHSFLALADSGEPAPQPDTTYQAVLTPIPDQVAFLLHQQSAEYAGYWIDLRDIPVGTEAADTLQMLVLTPVVIALIVFWLLLLQDPKRHPIYRQLSRYGMRVDVIVASIDREFAAGSVLSETRKLITTPTWIVRRSSFMTTIYKNTNPAADAVGDKGNTPDE